MLDAHIRLLLSIHIRDLYWLISCWVSHVSHGVLKPKMAVRRLMVEKMREKRKSERKGKGTKKGRKSKEKKRKCDARESEGKTLWIVSEMHVL